MRKFITTAAIAAGLFGLAACSGADNAAVANSDAGNAAAGLEPPVNDVTAVDSDGTLANADAAALPVENGLVSNLADDAGNGAAPAGNSF